MKRRVVETKPIDWEAEIKLCLTSKGKVTWGCLNRSGELFRISTLKKVQVPMKVVRSMEAKGQLYIPESSVTGMYRYKHTSLKRRQI